MTQAKFLNDSGKRDIFAWPGGYPIYYITADNGILCPHCANCKESLNASLDCPDDKQWYVVTKEINWEDETLNCDNCNTLVTSAYGEK